MPRKRTPGLNIWAEPSPSDFKRWEALVIAGDDPSHAAKTLDFAGSLTFRRADPVKHAEVLDVWRERRDADDRKTARDTLREIAAKKKAPPAARVSAAATLGKAAGMFDETQRVEISGPGGRPLEVDTDAAERLREKLAALVDDAREGDAIPADQ